MVDRGLADVAEQTLFTRRELAAAADATIEGVVSAPQKMEVAGVWTSVDDLD